MGLIHLSILQIFNKTKHFSCIKGHGSKEEGKMSAVTTRGQYMMGMQYLKR